MEKIDIDPKTRFEAELEFVQTLASPDYLNCASPGLIIIILELQLIDSKILRRFV